MKAKLTKLATADKTSPLFGVAADQVVGLRGQLVRQRVAEPLAVLQHEHVRAEGFALDDGEQDGALVTLDRAPCVGDSLRDLQAAAAVGAHPILVLSGKGAKTRSAGKLPEGTAVYPDLAAVAYALCQ